MAGLYKEVWIAAVMENFYREGEFLPRSVDMSGFVDNNKINLAEAGVVPSIIKNNTIYPLPVANRVDTALQLELDYYDTEGTLIANAEQKQYAYKKLQSVTYNHQKALRQYFSDLSAINWTPSENVDGATPVFGTQSTTAVTDIKGKPRFGFSIADITKMTSLFDYYKFPKQGRVCVLHPQHWAELNNQNALLYKDFTNLPSGNVINLYGWTIYVYGGTPLFNASTGVKLTYDSTLNPTNGTDSTNSFSSLFYCEDEVFRALGETDVFFTQKSTNAQYRSDIIGFQQRFAAGSIRNKAQGAVYSTIND
jgi:hypothetical protein